MSPPDRELKVVYILGFARSGTTILGNLLGEIDEFFHVGELYRVWPQAVRAKGRCGCEKVVPECPFWSEVLSRTLSGSGSCQNQDPIPAKEQEISSTRAWEIQRQARGKGSGLRRWLPSPGDRSRVERYTKLMETLLQNVSETSGSRVLVDSSKRPAFGRYLRSMPSVTPYYLHLVRDPRGSVFSRQRRTVPWDDGTVRLKRTTTLADSIRWMWSNLEAERVGRGDDRYMMVQYERFASHPQETMAEIARWLGESPERLPFTGGRTAWIGANHTVSGNRNRFQRGEVGLRVDNRWVRALKSRDYMLITGLTAPMLARYGYSLRRKREEGAPAPL